MGFKLDVERKERFFAVTTPLRINGKRYTPSVCYPLTEDIEAAVVGATEAGKTVIYNERVRFVSGRAFGAEKPVTVGTIPVAPESVPVLKAEQAAEGSTATVVEKETQGKKKPKKDF